ncbi:hypothetical protein BDZ94DRAFT_1312770 [Collybia nuda]|uniref:Uncharacterized protein n=1 Tax=Collybia nuda TaxID=64659 RepID=A0A9P5Y0H8_9AGAR|nr:hypothetical protein BDZ94DRAFT_1312770 [Collybia nuda]
MAKSHRRRRKRFSRRSAAYPTSGCVMLGIPAQQCPTTPDEMAKHHPVLAVQNSGLPITMSTIPPDIVCLNHPQQYQWPRGITVSRIELDMSLPHHLRTHVPGLAFPYPFPPILSSSSPRPRTIYCSLSGSLWYPRINCGWFQVTLLYRDFAPLSGWAWVHLWPTSEKPPAAEYVLPSSDALAVDFKAARTLHLGRFYTYTQPLSQHF